jgi:hypothetical protein|tara:strand:+ start:80 stop:334 length:255 start_codon:yes stop_codon:yes gene_type:complete
MKSLKQLVKEFASKGYANPEVHAKAKLWALEKIALAKQYSAPSLMERNSDLKIALINEPVVSYRSQHNLNPEDQMDLALAMGLV